MPIDSDTVYYLTILSASINRSVFNFGLTHYVIISMFTTRWRRLWLVRAHISSKCNQLRTMLEHIVFQQSQSFEDDVRAHCLSAKCNRLRMMLEHIVFQQSAIVW